MTGDLFRLLKSEGLEIGQVVVQPEALAELEEGEVDPLLLEDISRLAFRHERTSELFEGFRKRLGLPDPGEEPPPEASEDPE